MHLSVGNVPRQVETEVGNITEQLAWANDLLHLQPSPVFVLRVIVPYQIRRLPTRFCSHLDVGNRDLCLMLSWLKKLYVMLSHTYN